MTKTDISNRTLAVLIIVSIIVSLIGILSVEKPELAAPLTGALSQQDEPKQNEPASGEIGESSSQGENPALPDEEEFSEKEATDKAEPVSLASAP